MCSFNASFSSSYSSCQNHYLSHPLKSPLPFIRSFTLPRNTKKKSSASVWPLFCALNNQPLQYRNVGDSDLNISEITLGTVCHLFLLHSNKIKGTTLLLLLLFLPSFSFWLVPRCRFQMTFGEQNTEKEAHDILNYAFDRGINALDTAEAVRLFFIFICICRVCLDVAEVFQFFILFLLFISPL